MKQGITKLIAVVITALWLTGCATGQHQAFQAAHDSASKRGIAEAQSRQKFL